MFCYFLKNNFFRLFLKYFAIFLYFCRFGLNKYWIFLVWNWNIFVVSTLCFFKESTQLLINGKVTDMNKHFFRKNHLKDIWLCYFYDSIENNYEVTNIFLCNIQSFYNISILNFCAKTQRCNFRHLGAQNSNIFHIVFWIFALKLKYVSQRGIY